MATALLANFAAPLARVKVDPRVARPIFHLAPTAPRGWINDPNGPLLHNGTYHLFWQNVPNSSEWSWGLGWGHATSKDLVQWKPQPVALEPSPGGLDRHGCFSGCATVDINGVPSLLYTGVIRKPPHEIEPAGCHQHEAQLIAVAADPDDPELKEWVKLPGPFLPQPPQDMCLTGWRDPFILEMPTSSSSGGGSGEGSPWWYVMVGAGLQGKCGTALVYRSRDLKQGWEYLGPLCESPASDRHTMWECPIMALLSSTAPSAAPATHGHAHGHLGGSHAIANGHANGRTSSSGNARADGSQPITRHMLCVSPDYCVNVPLCYLGSYASGRFDLAGCDGPQRLDLGDVLYAPNVLSDAQGRTVLWAWMQEKQQLRPAGAYDSACCLCVPRVLYLSPDGRRLLQEPLPELAMLRQQQGAWHVGLPTATATPSTNSQHECEHAQGAAADAFEAPAALLPGVPLQLGGNGTSGGSSHVDLELTVSRGEADCVVLLLQPFEGLPGAAGAGIAYCWATDTLQVIHSTDFATLEAAAVMPVPPPTFKRLPGPTAEEAAAEAAAAAAAAGLPLRCGGALLRGCASDATNSDGDAGDGSGHAPATLTLRVLIDGSCVEVFAGGQALGTRVYRGDDHPVDHIPSAAELAAAAGALPGNGGVTSSDSGAIQLVCFGDGPAQLLSGSMWQMSSMWLPDAAAQQQQQEQEELLPAAAAAAAQVLQGLVAAEAAAVAAAAVAATPLVLPVGELSVSMPMGEGEAGKMLSEAASVPVEAA